MGSRIERYGLLAQPETASPREVAQLIVKFPLDRFVIQGLLEYDAQVRVVRSVQLLWQELRVRPSRGSGECGRTDPRLCPAHRARVGLSNYGTT